MEKDYLEWLDWKPGILRAIYELGAYGEVNWEDIKSHLGISRDTITDFLISMNIAEFNTTNHIILSEFGEELYKKLQEINYLFAKYIDMGDGEGD